MVKLSVTLSDRGRQAEGRRRVVDRLSELGARQTANGAATLSFEIPDTRFADAFGLARPKASRDETVIGASGPWDGAVIPVPKLLAEFVDSISVPPPARHHGRDP